MLHRKKKSAEPTPEENKDGGLFDGGFFEMLSSLSLQVSSDMRGYFGGSHRTASYGNTVEFADYREYVPGDDIRRIDWNLYSRFDKYYIKQFTDERQMHNRIFLDCSASMAQPYPKKAEYALKLAAALGYISVNNMDKTAYSLLYGDKCTELCPTIVGKDSFFHAARLLEGIEFSGECAMDRAICQCPNVGYCDGPAVIISDFLTDCDWKSAVDFLLYRKRQVLLIQVLTAEEADPSVFGRVYLMDAEALNPEDMKNTRMSLSRANLNAYKRALEEYRADIRHFCASRGCDFVCASCDEPIEKLLFSSLFETGVIG